MNRNLSYSWAIAAVAMLAIFLADSSSANNTWGSYHWARQATPFTLKLGSNVSSKWSASLGTASNDWSLSSVLDTTVVSGNSNRNCRATNGRVEVCSNKYGYNGWLGVASIWASGSHITQGTVKLNDSYFNTATYNQPAWRNLVMCQEVGHTFGLDHQDEDFSNANLNTCMDYTNSPDSNQHPNQHDYDTLEQIYSHLDAITTVDQSADGGSGHGKGKKNNEGAIENGKVAKKDAHGRSSVIEEDLGNGEKVFNFVIWADQAI